MIQEPKVLRNFHIRSAKDLIIPTQSLILASLEKDPANFRAIDKTVLAESGLFSQSEFYNNGAEIAQAISLKRMPGFVDKYLLPTGLNFFEESFFVLNPALTNGMQVPDIAN
jgi:hypothetical protein